MIFVTGFAISMVKWSRRNSTKGPPQQDEKHFHLLNEKKSELPPKCSGNPLFAVLYHLQVLSFTSSNCVVLLRSHIASTRKGTCARLVRGLVTSVEMVVNWPGLNITAETAQPYQHRETQTRRGATFHSLF